MSILRDGVVVQQEHRLGPSQDQRWYETDPSELMEGLYIKDEENDAVVVWSKFVRADCCSAVTDSGSHWLRRPIIPHIRATE